MRTRAHVYLAGIPKIRDYSQSISIEFGNLYGYMAQSSERLLMATKDENILDEGEEKESISQRRSNSHREKALHGQYAVLASQ